MVEFRDFILFFSSFSTNSLIISQSKTNDCKGESSLDVDVVSFTWHFGSCFTDLMYCYHLQCNMFKFKSKLNV